MLGPTRGVVPARDFANGVVWLETSESLEAMPARVDTPAVSRGELASREIGTDRPVVHPAIANIQVHRVVPRLIIVSEVLNGIQRGFPIRPAAWSKRCSARRCENRSD